jgi:hypothetical protein
VSTAKRGRAGNFRLCSPRDEWRFHATRNFSRAASRSESLKRTVFPPIL